LYNDFFTRKVLVIAPHYDDEVIGCGGTLIKYREYIKELVVVHLTYDDVRLQEFNHVKNIMQVNKHFGLTYKDGFLADHYKDCVLDLIKIIQMEKPDIVFVPHRQDKHVDHVTTSMITDDAVGKARYWSSFFELSPHKVSHVLEYEIWHPQSDVSITVDITNEFSKKLKLMESYRSQLGFPYLCYIDAISTWRGLIHQKQGKVEAFHLLSVY
jgi:LmbE family N-acetylglucosaminyl deacetylase